MDKYHFEGHKLYWHLDRIQEWQKKRNIVPIYVEVSPVSFCNHRCIFCGLDFAMQKNILRTELLTRRLREMGELGVRSMMYAGEGEPLLHADLHRMIKETKKNRIDVALTTNGTLGTVEIWKSLLPHLTWVKFSVDAGTAAIYSKVHNVPESYFDTTLHSITAAAAVRKKMRLGVTIGVQFLIIDENIDDIENAIRVFSRLPIDYVVFKPYSRHPKMIKKKDMAYTSTATRRIEKIIERYRSATKVDLIFRKETLEQYRVHEKNFQHCYALPFWVHISANGDVYCCSVFLYDERFRVGNIYRDSMRTIFLGKKRAAILEFGEKCLSIEKECRVNCRMSKVNEFLEFLEHKPEHINFI